VIKVKVIDLPRENLTSKQLEDLISKFIDEEKPDKIIHLGLAPEYPFLIILYQKGWIK
jgi:hypothetical protein